MLCLDRTVYLGEVCSTLEEVHIMETLYTYKHLSILAMGLMFLPTVFVPTSEAGRPVAQSNVQNH
jgi:hypothetical protein